MFAAHPCKMDTAQVPDLRDAVVCVPYRTERQFKDWHQAIVGADDLHRPEGSAGNMGETVSRCREAAKPKALPWGRVSPNGDG